MEKTVIHTRRHENLKSHKGGCNRIGVWYIKKREFLLRRLGRCFLEDQGVSCIRGQCWCRFEGIHYGNSYWVKLVQDMIRNWASYTGFELLEVVYRKSAGGIWQVSKISKWILTVWHISTRLTGKRTRLCTGWHWKCTFRLCMMSVSRYVTKGLQESWQHFLSR
jgi:hypothetical protein